MADSTMLAEHQAADTFDNDQSPPTGTPPEATPGEEKAKKLVERLFCKAKKERQPFDKEWVSYYKYYRGDQWKNRRASYRHAEVINFIWQTIQSIVPIMTDARPKPTFSPTDPSDLEFAEVLNSLFEADWQNGNWLYKLSEILYDGHVFGTGISNLYFDRDCDYGIGRIKYDTIDPIDFYPDPNARDTNDRAQYMITAVPTDIDVIKSEYPNNKFTPFIKADLVDITSRNSQHFERMYAVRNYDKDMPTDNYSTEAESHIDKAMVVTLYMTPNDTIEEKGQTGSGDATFKLMKKYPKGRKIVKVNDFIMLDEPLDNDDLSFPFSRYANYIDQRRFWGVSEIEQLESPQRIFNKLISFVLDVLTFTGNPIWLVPTGSGVKPGSFHNAPGMQVPFDGDRAPTRVEGTQLQPYVLQMIDRMENWFNGISGTQDVTRGIQAPGVTAASAIENLQDAAQTRIRQKMRNMDGYLQEVGRQWVQLCLQHYTVPRVFRYTDTQDVDKYFKFWIEYLKDNAGQQIMDDKGDPIRVGSVIDYDRDEHGSMVPVEPTRKYLICGMFDVKVSTGSGLPFAKSEKENKLLQLFDRGIIDREELLNQIEYPNADAVNERMAEKESQMQQMQQQGA